ncbi:MAG: type II toxin-antitoxin system VapC family toxin [Chloroflexi bacterium]|nr:type II toxin-antitoxin system VapC family toxin [Chloroflexota bacterium]
MSDKRVVIDASAALKWRLRDEEATEQADALLDNFLSDDLELWTPTLFDYEIANALKTAVAVNRLTETDALIAIRDFREYQIERRNFHSIQEAALQFALRHQRSAYDGAYLALAQSEGLWFYTGDKRLFNAVGKALPWVKWIGDYLFARFPRVHLEVDKETGRQGIPPCFLVYLSTCLPNSPQQRSQLP